jgi:hypothetical protein
VIDQRLDEGGLVDIQEGVARARGPGGRLRLRIGGWCDRNGAGGSRSAANNRAFQKITAVEALVVHKILPDLPPVCIHQFADVSKRRHTFAALKPSYGSD